MPQLAEVPKQELEIIPPSPMHLIQSAIMAGASIDTIERLTKLQREMMEYDAKVAFDGALHRAQSEMKRIGTDAINPQTKSRYATYAKLDGALRPIYSKEGFAVSFDTADPPAVDTVRVVAYVSHQNGHTRRYQLDMPADGKGAKGGDVMTKTHATGAAMSYGMRYLLKMIFNVAVGEEDDDGNLMSPEVVGQRGKILFGMERAQSEEQLTSLYRAGIKDALHSKDYEGIKMIEKARERRRKELNGEVVD